MNDEIMTRLKILVETAVRPVRASRLRKRRMREELFAHVVATFEEEMPRLDDESRAIAQTERRFGDPQGLAFRLQESIPRRDWLTRLREMGHFRPRESLLHRAITYVLLNFIPYVGAMMLFGSLSVIRGRLLEFRIASYTLFVMLVLMTGILFVFSLFVDRIYQALYERRSERSLPRAIICALASVPVFPVFILAFYWVLTGGVALTHFQLSLTCLGGLLTPAILIFAARETARDVQLDEKWTSLYIDES